MIGICFAKTPEAVQFFDLVHKKLALLNGNIKIPPSKPVSVSAPVSSKGQKRPQIGVPIGFKYILTILNKLDM